VNTDNEAEQREVAALGEAVSILRSEPGIESAMESKKIHDLSVALLANFLLDGKSAEMAACLVHELHLFSGVVEMEDEADDDE
jgi:hypothetical protein